MVKIVSFLVFLMVGVVIVVKELVILVIFQGFGGWYIILNGILGVWDTRFDLQKHVFWSF